MLEEPFNQLWRWYKKMQERKEETKMLSSTNEKKTDRTEHSEIEEETKQDRQLIEYQDKQELLSPEVLRSEVNFLIFPFFALWDKDLHRRTETEYTAEAEREDQKLKISWKVLAHPEFGYPGPFDRQLHKVIEQIINEMELPIENPIPLGSLRSLCRRMGISGGGDNIARIKEALIRVRATTVESKGAFYDKGKKRWIEDYFSLYGRVIFTGEELPDGKIADTNYLYLGSWYLESINTRYVKPIDWDYYKTLDTPIAERLYEILGVKFYRLFQQGGKYIHYKYSTLCDLLPITRQHYLSKARQILDPSHEKLQETGFLAKYEWVTKEKYEKEDENDWLLRYYPGKRAREEFERFQGESALPEDEDQETQALEGKEKDPGVSTPEQPEPTKEKPDQEDTVEILTEMGISDKVARDLTGHHDREHILEKIDYLHYLQERDPEKVKNPCGWLRQAIEEDYAPPNGYEAEEKREREAAERERRRQDMIRRREEQIERQKQKEAEVLARLHERYGTTQREREVWQEALEQMQLSTTKGIFNTWLANTRLLSLDDQKAVIGVTNEYQKDWLEEKLARIVRKALRYLGHEVDLEFEVVQED